AIRSRQRFPLLATAFSPGPGVRRLLRSTPWRECYAIGGTCSEARGRRVRKASAACALGGSRAAGSAIAFDGQPGQHAQLPGPAVEAGQRLLHRMAEGAQAFARGFDADQRRERGLVLFRVLAGGLAEGRAVALDVEQVVADLEGQAERVGEAVQALAGRRVDAGGNRAQAYRRAQQRAGLERVQALEFVGAQALRVAGRID